MTSKPKMTTRELNRRRANASTIRKVIFTRESFRKLPIRFLSLIPNFVKVTARTLIALEKAKGCLHAMKGKLSRRRMSELLFKRFHVQMHVKVGMSSGHSFLPSPHIRLWHPKQSPQPHPILCLHVGRGHALCPTAFSCKPDSDESVIEDKGMN